MTQTAFNRLVDILDLTVNETKGKNSTGGVHMICIINNDDVPTYLLDANSRHANNQRPAVELAANGVVPLENGMGENVFIAVGFDAEEGLRSCQDAIVTDHTTRKFSSQMS
jgi:hypothetical protein